MKPKTHTFFLTAVLPLLIAILQGCSRPEKNYHAIEMSGIPMGYIEGTAVDSATKSKRPFVITSRIIMRMTLLGQPMDIFMKEKRRFSPGNRRPDSIHFLLDSGQMKVESLMEIEGDVAHFFPRTGGKAKKITLDPGIFVSDDELHASVVKTAGDWKEKTRTFRILDYVRGNILEQRFILTGVERLILEVGQFDCLTFLVRDLSLGIESKLWLEKQSGKIVRLLANDRTIYISDRQIRDRIRRASLDKRIMVMSEVKIPQVENITYMKVRARIRSVGEVLSADSLNVPGQDFNGTVTDNLIEGTFEIEQGRYSGDQAPPFPPDYSSNNELKDFLEPELLIESDDPVLIKKAAEITAGSTDSWEAAKRLARWVGTEISGELVSGSARQTYNSRKGECGSHSRLYAALCRGVGIPCRVVSGGANFGPGFGQHGWNEVYMGAAGWIPLDTTFKEFDYIDSGHIRLGFMVSFQPEVVEIIEHRLDPAK